MSLSWHENVFALKKAWTENGGDWSDQECRIIEARERAKEKSKMEMTITMYDGNGNVTLQETREAPTATEEEINAMIELIDGGMPAHMAAGLVKPQS